MDSKNTVFPFSLCVMLALAQIAAAQGDTGRTCRKGTFETGNDCRTCPRNSYSDTINAFKCTECPPLLRSAPGSTSLADCHPCGPGKVTIRGPRRVMECRPCPIDTYSDEEIARECKPCPSGTVSSIGSKVRSDCTICSPGRVVRRGRAGNTRCALCPDGQSSFQNNAKKCKDCPRGTFRRRSVRSLSDECIPCPPGSFSGRPGMSRCSRCPKGSFQNEMGAKTCKLCPAVSTTRSDGAKSCIPKCNSNSPGCISCPPGQEYNTESKKCKVCPPGTISPGRSSTPCYRCPGERRTVNAARTRCICFPGFKLARSGSCILCRSGKTNEDGGKCLCIMMERKRSDGCVCPPLTRTVNDRCVPCKEGEASCRGCPSGASFNKAAGRCETCPENTFNLFGDRCMPCPGESTSLPGSFACTCGAGRGLQNGKCMDCPPGTFADTTRLGGPNCRPCFGRFSDKPGTVNCRACPKELRPLKSGATACLKKCPKGAERRIPLSQECQCKLGLVSAGAGENLTCTACPRNEVVLQNRCVCPSRKFGGTGKSKCLPCEAAEMVTGGRCDCDFGAIRVKGKCEFCPAGTRKTGKRCAPCSPGTVSGIGDTFCSSRCRSKEEVFGTKCLPFCPVRSFRNAAGDCESCAKGQRVLNRTCIDCEAGSVSKGGRSAVCITCKRGQVPNKRNSKCVDP